MMAFSNWHSVVAAIAFTAGVAGQATRDAIQWWTDLPAAEAEARKSKKPLLLVFR